MVTSGTAERLLIIDYVCFHSFKRIQTNNYCGGLEKGIVVLTY